MNLIIILIFNLLSFSIESILEAYVSDDTNCVKDSGLTKCGSRQSPYKYLEGALSDISDSILKGELTQGDIEIYLMKEVNYVGYDNPRNMSSLFEEINIPLNITILPMVPLQQARLVFMTICIDMHVKGTLKIRDLIIEEQIQRMATTGLASEFRNYLQTLYESDNNERYFLILDAKTACVFIENTVFVKLKARDIDNNFVYSALIGTTGKPILQNITILQSQFLECFFPKGIVFLPTNSAFTIVTIASSEVVKYNPDLLFIDWEDQIIFQPNKDIRSYASLYGFCFFVRAAKVSITNSFFTESTLYLFADLSNVTIEGTQFRGFNKMLNVDPHLILLHVFCSLVVRSTSFSNFSIRDKYEKFYDSVGIDTTNLTDTLYYGSVQQGLIEMKAFGKIIMQGVTFDSFEIFRSEILNLGLILINTESSGLFAYLNFSNFKVWEETIKDNQKVGRICSGLYGIFKTYLSVFNMRIKKMNIISNYLADIVSVAILSTLSIQDSVFEEIFMQSLASLPIIEGKIGFMLLNMENLSLIEVTMKSIAIGIISCFDTDNLTIDNSEFKNINCLYACGGLIAAANKVNITNTNYFSISTNFFSGLWALGSGNTLNLFNVTAQKIKGMNGGILYAYKMNEVKINGSFFLEMRAQPQSGFGNFTDASGGFIFADRKNKIFINNTKAKDLGAPKFGAFGYILEENSVDIRNCYIYTLESDKGGFFYVYYFNDVYIENSYLEEGFTTIGGFFYLLQSNRLTCRNNIYFNYSAGYGGALIAFYDNFISIDRSSFSESRCYNGSMIYLRGYDGLDNILIFNNSQFITQKSYSHGGAIYLYNYNSIIVDTFIMNFNSGEVDDTLITADYFNNVTLKNSYIYGFDDPSVVAAFYFEILSIIVINNCTFSKFLSGIIFANELNEIKINNSNFVYHTIRITDGILKINSDNSLECSFSKFENNTETIMGGVLNAGENNIIVFNFTKHSYITSLNSGTVFYLLNNNTLTCLNSFFNLLYNVFGGGMVITAVMRNSMNFNSCKYFDDFGPIRSFTSDPWPAIFFIFYKNILTLTDNVIILDIEELNKLQFLYSERANTIIMRTTTFSSLRLQYIFTINSGSILTIENSKIVENWVRRPIIFSRSSDVNIKNSIFISNHNFDINSTLFIFYFSKVKVYNMTIRGWLKYLKVFKFLYSSVSFYKSQSNFCHRKNPLHSPPVNLADQLYLENYYVYSLASTVILDTFNLLCYVTTMAYSPMVFVNSELKMHRCLIAFNTARVGFGGCIFINGAKNTHIYHNSFLANKAYAGGVGALFSFGDVSIEANIFELNKALVNSKFNDKEMSAIMGMEGYIGTLKGKGGVFYIGDTRENISSYLKIESNTFKKNKASIGAITFTRNTPIEENLLIAKNKIISNKFSGYGKHSGSNIISVNLVNGKNAALIEEVNINFKLIRNQSLPYCLLVFHGYDNYSQNAVGNEEVSWDVSVPLVAEDINTLEKENITLEIKRDDGYLCLHSISTSNLRVLSKTLSVRLNSKDLAEKTHLMNSSEFVITFTFRNCTQGEKFVPETLICEPCPPFFYSFLNNFSDPNTCYRCYGKPFYCYGGDNLSPKPGFWRFDEKSTNFLKCPNSESCLGDPLGPIDAVGSEVLNPFDNFLSTGPCMKGYTGIVCAECIHSYGDVGGYKCASCQDPFFYIALALKILFKILFLSYSADKALNLCRSLEKREGNLDIVKANFLIKVFLQHMQALMILTSFPFEWDLKSFFIIDITLGIVTPELTNTFTTECLVKGGSLGLKNVYFQLILSLVFPFIIVGLVLSYNVLKRNRGERKFQRRRKEWELSNTISALMGKSSQVNEEVPRRTRSITIKQYLKREISFESITLIVLSIYYIDILKISTEMFSFISVGGETQKILRLKSDMSVDYFSPSHAQWKYLLALPVLILVGLCIPGYLFYRLYTQRKKGELHKSRDFLFKFGYFFYPYDEAYYYYDFIFLLRRLVLMFLQVFSIDTIKFYYKLNSAFYITIITIVLGISLFLHMRISPFNSKNFGVINRAESYSLITLLNSYFIGTLWLINLREEEAELGEPIWHNSMISMFVFLLIALANLFFFTYWIKAFLKHGDLHLEQKWKAFTSALVLFKNRLSNCKKKPIKIVRSNDRNSTRKNAAKLGSSIHNTEIINSPIPKHLTHFARHSIPDDSPIERRKKSSSQYAGHWVEDFGPLQKDFRVSERVKGKESLNTDVEEVPPALDSSRESQEIIRYLREENEKLRCLLKKTSNCAVLNKLLIKELNYWKAFSTREAPRAESQDAIGHNHTFLTSKKKVECMIGELESHPSSEECLQREKSGVNLAQRLLTTQDERRDQDVTPQPVLDINVKKISQRGNINDELQYVKLSFLITNRTENHLKEIEASINPISGMVSVAELTPHELSPFGSLHLRVFLRLTKFFDPLEYPIMLNFRGRTENESQIFHQNKEIFLEFHHLLKIQTDDSPTYDKIIPSSPSNNKEAEQALTLSINQKNFEFIEMFLRRFSVIISSEKDTVFRIHSPFEDTKLQVDVSREMMQMKICYLKRKHYRLYQLGPSAESGCEDMNLLNYLMKLLLPF